YVVFASGAANLVTSDTNLVDDIFVRDGGGSGGSSITSLCSPGLGGVAACPCANAPSASGRGCNNSNGTGGAVLSAVGTASLLVDTLTFSTSAEMPTAPSILMQGTQLVSSGAVFGQGIRCVGGTLSRMYVKTASAGSITAPLVTSGDAKVSSRSAALGDTIVAG